MSRLIIFNLDMCQDLKPEGQEYGYCVFKELPNISTIKKVSLKISLALNDIMVTLADLNTDLQLGITCE